MLGASANSHAFRKKLSNAFKCPICFGAYISVNTLHDRSGEGFSSRAFLAGTMYKYVIHTVLQWRYLKAACAGYLFNDNKYLQNISIEHWDKLADKCWGKYPSRHGPNSLADRVLTLKECVRLRCDTTLAEALKGYGYQTAMAGKASHRA